MIKHLSTTILFLACSLVSLAVTQGDYVYTKAACFYLTGRNQVENGMFGNGLDGWTTATGEALSGDDFSVDGSGPDGTNCLTVLRYGTNSDGASILKTFPVQGGRTYVITYKARSMDISSTTSVSNEEMNYQNVYYNTDGSCSLKSDGFVAIAKTKSYTSDWTEITYNYTPAANGYIVINFSGLQVGDSFTDFGVFDAYECGDDRRLKKLYDVASRFLDDPRFPNGKEEFRNVVNDVILGSYEAGLHDAYTIEDIESTFYTEFLATFLDANTVKCNEYLKYMDFETGITAPQWKVGNIGGSDAWVCTPGAGDRWMLMPPSYPSRSQAYFNSVYVDYQVGNGTTELKDGELRQTADLPPGEYLFSIRGLGYRFEGRTSNPDYDYDIEGTSLFVNDGKTQATPLEVGHVNTFYTIGEVREGEKISFGVSITGKQGHWYSFDDAELRYIGTDPSVIEEYVLGKELAAARKSLREAIDSANIVITMPDYLFEKTAFSEKIAAAQNIYDSSRDMEEITTQSREVLNGIADYIHANVGYTNLRNDLAHAKAIANADETLTAVINAVDQYFAALTERPDDAVTEKNKALLDAENNFLKGTASYNTPMNVRFFNETFANESYGWETDDLGNWKYIKDDRFTTGRAIHVWRGVTAHDAKYVWQDVELPGAGVYELSAEIIALNEQQSSDLEETGVYLIAGDEKLQVHTKSAPQTFTIKLTVNDGTMMRIGLDGRENAVCNTITMGNVVLRYYGPADKYEEDSKAGALAEAKKELEDAIAVAQNYLSSSRNPNGVDTKPFADAIATAQSKTNGTLEVLKEAKEALLSAQRLFMLSGVYPAEGTCFDVTFAINDAEMNNPEAWTVEATEDLVYSEEGGFYGYFRASSGNVGTIGQDLKNMPAGKYVVETDASFRWAAPSNFQFDWYNGTRDIWLHGANERVRLKGLVEGYTNDDVKDNVLTYDNGATLTLYDYTHATNIFPILDTQAIENKVEFQYDGTEDLNIHIYYNIRQSSAIWVSAFRLYFLGDDKGNLTGIDTVEASDSAAERAQTIYNLAGQRVRTPQRGIFIINGKKYVIK